MFHVLVLRRCVIAAAALVAMSLAAVAAEWPPAPPLPRGPDEPGGRLPPSVTAEPAAPGTWRATFRVKPDGPAKSVTLAGTFNGWNKEMQPLEGPRGDGAWLTTVTIPSGQHEYKFVIDGDRWMPDPLNPERVPDGHQGFNSVLRIGRRANLDAASAKSGDGRIESGALEHDPESPSYFQLLPGGIALVRYRALRGDLEQVAFALRGGAVTPMDVVDTGAVFTLYEATVPVRRGGAPAGDTIEYTFVLKDGNARMSDPTTYKRSVDAKLEFHTPEWARHAVWYQIMVDRFRNGNKDNDYEYTRPWTSEWFTPSPWEQRDGQTFYKHYVFDRMYGGDFDGLEQKLPYLKELGVNALYLNPIFLAPGHHKYNASDYRHIDDGFGVKGSYEAVVEQEDLLDPQTWRWSESDKRFLAFLKAAKAQGFRVILDGVFNHVGPEFPAFVDIRKNRQESRFADWFDVSSWEPFKYNGWAGFDGLPVFKKSRDGLASAAVKAHIFAVTRRWMDPDGDGDPRDGIDGWRLDVPNEIPMPFWVEWRALVKSINPDAYITGEIWDRAEAWLDGRHFDAVMNYPFSRAVVAWIFDRKSRIRAAEFDRRLRELRLAYPLAATLVMQNLMNSHDTDRLASMAFNPDRAYDHANRAQDNGPNYNNAKPDAAAYARARLAAFVQMTYVGAPMIYYGDEVGMWGADDPTCRKPMLWADLQPYDKADENCVMKEQLAHYQRIIALRNAHAALRVGGFRTLLADDDADVWVFVRQDGHEQVIVAANPGDVEHEVHVTLPAGLAHRWSGAFGVEGALAAHDGTLTFRVPAIGGVALVAERP